MSEKTDQREKLLAELFTGDWVDGPAAEFARTAAAYARRRRAVRQTLLAGSAALGVGAAIVLSAVHRAGPPAASPVAVRPLPAYEIISDDQLLAQLPNRPVLVLPQPDGGKKIVLLDQ